MKRMILKMLLLGGCASACAGEGFRISEVVRQASEGVEELTLKGKGREERLFVKKEAVLDEGDVTEAVAMVEVDPKISVRLTEEGSQKMKAAAERLRGERLAIVVEGRLIMAPVILATLEDNFVISGNFELREAQNLARTIMGKPALAPEAPDDPLPTPKVKTEPYSEEEYQARKAEREKVGMFFLDKVPSKDELNVAVGTTSEEVVRVFGRPWIGPEKLRGDYMLYEIAPEKRPGTSKVPSGFSISFRDGKVAGWGFCYSTVPREEKVVGREPGLLKATAPQADFSADQFDFIKYFEGIQVPDPQQEVNLTDLQDLLTMTLQVAGAVNPAGKTAATVRSDCDLMRTLAHHFPEVDALRKNAAQGRVRMDVLNSALMPYMTNGKPLPQETSSSAAGDAVKKGGPPSAK